MNLSLRGRMVVEFTTTCAIAAYHPLSCEFEPHSWRGALDKTLCDIKQLNMYDFVKIIFKVSNITSNLTHKMKTVPMLLEQFQNLIKKS